MKRFCAIFLGFNLVISSAQSADYEFTKIADTASGDFTALAFASVNNDGTVLFRGVDADSIAGVYSAPPVAVISDETDARFESLAAPSLGNNGFVAFNAFETGGLDNAIYRTLVGNNNPAEVMYDTRGQQFSCLANPSINSSGVVAFIGESGTDCLSFGPAAIYVGSGGPPTLIDTSGDFLEITSDPTINDDGTVMFMAERTLDDFGIYTWDGQAFTTIIENGSTYLAFLGPSMNCDGTVAAATIPFGGGGRTIIKGNGGPVTTVVDESSGLIEFRRPSINCSETIAFIARTPDFQNDGIYVATDEGIDTVIMTGDTLEGLTVENIFSDLELNDSGQLVFRAELCTGECDAESVREQYIFVASQIQYVDVSGVADISGDAVPDIAELRYTGQPQVRYFSGATRDKIKSVNYLGPAWRSVAAATVVDGNRDGVADDPAVAVLGTNPYNGKRAVEVRRAADGALLYKIDFMGPNWTVRDVAVIDDLDGDGVPGDTAVAALGVNPERGFLKQIKVQVRRLHDGKLLVNWFFFNSNWTALALEGVSRMGAKPLLAVLGQNAASGATRVQARRLSDGAVQGNTTFLTANWAGQDVALVLDSNGDGTTDDAAYLVLANNVGTGANKVQARRVSDGVWLKNIKILATNWRAVRVTGTDDISGNLGEEVGVLAVRRSDGKLAIQLKDFADRTTTATIFP